MDLSQVQAFLEGHLGAEVSDLELLRGGDWSQAFGFRASDRDLVIRFGHFVEDFKKDRAAGKNSSLDLPIPAVFEIGEELDHYYCLSRQVFGEMIDNLDEEGMGRIVPATLRMLDALRTADPSGVAEQSSSWPEQLLRVDVENERVFGWHDRMASSPLGPAPYNAALVFLRERLSDLPDAKNLVHNDLLHNNLITAEDKIVGVIDWGNAIEGDFLYDLAMFTFYSPYFPAMKGIDWLQSAKDRFGSIGLEVPDLDLRMQCYEVHLGLSGMAYSSFKSNWKDYEWNAERTFQRMRTS